SKRATVVLPLPLSPTRAVAFPGYSASDVSSTACTARADPNHLTAPSGKSFFKWTASRIGSPAICATSPGASVCDNDVAWGKDAINPVPTSGCPLSLLFIVLRLLLAIQMAGHLILLRPRRGCISGQLLVRLQTLRAN